MRPLFDIAEQHVAEYFDQRRFEPEQGTIDVFGTRYIMLRGAANNPGELVDVAVPEVLRSMRADFQPGERPPRLELAEWITHPNNALAWRVMANRVWRHLFGRGLVTSPSNFGTSGQSRERIGLPVARGVFHCR